jgi:DNA-binding transcriptional regulator YdaS (Cro superfamily)
MKLVHYLTAHHITDSQFAAAVAVTRPTVNLWKNEHTVPLDRRMKMIERATNGNVTDKDFRSRRHKRR